MGLRPSIIGVAQWLVLALLVAACGSGEGDIPPGQQAVPCGVVGDQIDTRQFLGQREKDAVELGRRHGCHVLVELRDGITVAPGLPTRPNTMGVTTRDGYVDRLCLIHSADGRCVPSRG
jgi:hypothetical protein